MSYVDFLSETKPKGRCVACRRWGGWAWSFRHNTWRCAECGADADA